MAYQSIFNGGGAKTPTKTNPLAEDFTPGKFAKVNADIAARQPKVAPQAPHITAVGPTSKWARLAQIGVGAVQKAKITAENVGKNVTSDFVNIGKEANRNIVQPIVNPQKGPGAATIMQAQAKAQAAAKSGRVSPEAIKALGQIQSPYDKLTAYQVVGDKTLNKQQMLAKLNPVIQKQSAQTKKALGAALEISSLAVGGGSLKTVTTGGKLLKAGVTNAAAGATGGVGSTLVTNPNANKKQLAKAAGIGAATGVVATVGGKVAGKAGETVKTVLGKDKAVNTTLKTAKQNVLLQTGKKANANEEASKAALKSAPIKIPVKEAITDEAKLLPAGEKVTQGKGFTMAEKVNPNSISKQKEITQLQDRITKFQQGKLSITPEQAKTDATRLNALKTGKAQPVAEQPLTGKYGETLTAPKTPTVLKPTAKLVKTSGPTVPSQLAVKVRARAIEHGLAQDFADVREHTQLNMKEQSQRAADLINSDPQRALDIVNGKRSVPSNIHPAAMLNAVEAHAIQTGNSELMRQLEKSKLMDVPTAGGQTLRIARERNQDSPVAAIHQIVSARSAAAEQKLKQPVTKAITQTAKEIDKAIKRPSTLDWHAFVEGIKC